MPPGTKNTLATTLAALQFLYSISQFSVNSRPMVDPEYCFEINSNFAQVNILTIETF